MAHILMATPLHGKQVHLHFMTSVMAVFNDLGNHKHTASFAYCESSDIASNRNVLCKNALERNADYILFCDSDMGFPGEIVSKMIASGKGCIGAAACLRGFRFPLGAVGYDGPHNSLEERLAHHTKPNYVPISGRFPNPGETIEVSHVGTGIMLIATYVLRDLLDRQIIPLYRAYELDEVPLFFKFDYTLDSCGEDYGFCQTLRNAGHKVYVFGTDEVLHYGEYPYRRALPSVS